MKKILLSTIILFAFSLSIILFEISCKKSGSAQSTNTMSTSTSTQQNKIIYLVYNDNPNTGVIDQIYSANYDGSDAQPINITLPLGVAINDNSLALSPDHKTIFFTAGTNSGTIDIYSCNFDGSNAIKVISNGEHPVAF